MRVIQLKASNFKRLEAVEIYPESNTVVISGKNGAGKQAPISEPVLTPDGWRKIGDIQVGDEVIGASGFAVKVLEIFPQTSREVYEVRMADGGVTRCGPDHLWTASRWKGTTWSTETLTLAQMLHQGIYTPNGKTNKKRKWAVPLVGDVAFSSQTENLPIDPWQLGLILGDGHIVDTGYVSLTTDRELIDRLDIDNAYIRETDSDGIAVLGSGVWSFRLQALDLAGRRSEAKFVPAAYLRAAPSQRKALLAGLLDSDGTTSNRSSETGTAEFCSTSKALAEAVVELTRSLGGIGNVRGPITKKYTYKGEKREGQPAWMVTLHLPFNPFTLKRKAERWAAPGDRRPLRRYIDSVERVADEDCVCIRIDAEDGLYVANDYIVTHNSSVLDAIWMALEGSTGKGTPMPVRNGETEAQVWIDLGDIVVKRTWNAVTRTSRLEVTSPEGERLGSPQGLLDSLLGRLSFDPQAFTRQKPKDQRATLLDLVDLNFDPDALSLERKTAFEERTAVNRDVKKFETLLAGLPIPAAGLPDEEITPREIMTQISAVHAAEQERIVAKAELQSAGARRDACRDEIAATKARLAELEDELTARQINVESAIEKYNALPEPTSVESLEADLANIETMNAKIREAKDRRKMMADLDEVIRQAEALTNQIEHCDRRQVEGLAAAKLPVAGLAFDDDGVTFNGIPFSQCSAAEQLRVSVAIAMSVNPDIRVIRITDGSLLDSESMATITAMADANDMQVWIEVVDESGDLGVYIEDGNIIQPHSEGF